MVVCYEELNNMSKHLERFKHEFKEHKRNLDVPDADFNPARNQAVINQVLTEADTYHKRIGNAFNDAMGERFEAVAYYGDAVLNRGSAQSIKQYLGDKLYTELIGERLLEKIRVAKSVDRLGRKFIPL